MARWKAWWKRAVEAILDGSHGLCMVCGGRASHTVVCESCGVTACRDCCSDRICPNCGDPV